MANVLDITDMPKYEIEDEVKMSKMNIKKRVVAKSV
jgi:hypothetical protein